MTLRTARMLTAIYDLGWYAPTFNICEFLTGARIWEAQHGFSGTKLIILKRKIADAIMIQPQPPAEYDFRIHDILLAATALFPLDEVVLTADLESVRDAAAAAGESVFPPDWNHRLDPAERPRHLHYLQGFLRDHVKAGGELPGIRVPVVAFKKMRALLEKLPRPWISITLRNTPYIKARNSNLATWSEVARHFKATGASVFMLPDLESLERFEAPDPVSMMAVSNLSYRTALYDACHLNLAVNNGTSIAMWFNPSCVFLLAKFATEGTNSSAQSAQALLGLKPGDDPWSRLPWQQILWSNDDDAAAIVREAEAMLRFTGALRAEVAADPLLCDPWGKPDGTLAGLWRGMTRDMPAEQLKQEVAQRTEPVALEKHVPRATFSSKRHLLWAEHLLAQGRLEDALAAAKQADRLDGRYPHAPMLIAECLARMGRIPLAERYRSAAKALRPREADEP